jgi:5'-3' exonuclease
MIVHLIDGTYELFRQYYGRRGAQQGLDSPFGAAAGVLHSVLAMIESGATHVGVATDHVIESFRNDLWPGYKTGDGIDPLLWAQFHPLEDALAAMGVVVWPMVRLEADDALASAASLASGDTRVERVCIWTPDKDLAQCVRGDRVVQRLRRGDEVRDSAGVRAKFGVDPESIPDFLALVGDTADGYPGIAGIGRVGAARLINRHGRIEDFPSSVLGAERGSALLFKDLATLRTDEPLFADVSALEWRGAGASFDTVASRLGDAGLARRAEAAAARGPFPSPSPRWQPPAPRACRSCDRSFDVYIRKREQGAESSLRSD